MVVRSRLAMVLVILALSVVVFAGTVTRHALMREDLSLVNPLDSGSALNDTTLSAAATSIGALNRCLVITPGTWTIAANLTFASNVCVYLAPEAIFSVNAGVTLTIAGQIVDVSRPQSDATAADPPWKTGTGTLTVTGYGQAKVSPTSVATGSLVAADQGMNGAVMMENGGDNMVILYIGNQRYRLFGGRF